MPILGEAFLKRGKLDAVHGKLKFRSATKLLVIQSGSDSVVSNSVSFHPSPSLVFRVRSQSLVDLRRCRLRYSDLAIKKKPFQMSDKEIFPHATGAAASLVAAHSGKQSHIFYAGWFCPFVQRAWLVLEEKKIPYQYVEINPYHKEKSFLELNPRGLVPTLGCPSGAVGKETKPLYESSVICEYLNEVFVDPEKHGPNLLPEDAYERARARIWIDHISSRIVPTYFRFLQHQPHSPYSIEETRAEFLGHLKTFIKEADPAGPFFLGPQISLVDVTLAPWLVRLWLFDHFKEGGLGLPGPGEGGEDEQVWQRWRDYAKAVEERKSVKETLSDWEWYIPIYQRYADDTAQSEAAKATRSGKSLP